MIDRQLDNSFARFPLPAPHPIRIFTDTRKRRLGTRKWKRLRVAAIHRTKPDPIAVCVNYTLCVHFQDIVHSIPVHLGIGETAQSITCQPKENFLIEQFIPVPRLHMAWQTSTQSRIIHRHLVTYYSPRQVVSADGPAIRAMLRFYRLSFLACYTIQIEESGCAEEPALPDRQPRTPLRHMVKRRAVPDQFVKLSVRHHVLRSITLGQSNAMDRSAIRRPGTPSPP